jgi:hypothetical protein
MKKTLVFAVTFLVLFSCTNKEENTMYVKGTIDGLKKGTLYLQKQIDSAFVSVDSISINGTSDFLLSDKVESPEIYFLSLGNGYKSIPFFGEKDSITINTKLDKFELKAEIKGSENQELLDKYNDMIKQFNNKNLDLIKEDFEARRSGYQDSIILVENKRLRLLKTQSLYAVNFAIQNADHEVAPYIALTEVNTANIQLLDTINKSLTPTVKASKYGKQLEEAIIKLKENN